MEPQSQGDTAAPGKQKARQQQAHVQQDFLFIDSSKPAQTSRQGRRTARSFVMQRARRERPWSTSKHAGKQAPSRRSPDSASVGTPDAYHTPFTQPTTPTTPGDVPLAGDVDLARVADNNSFFLAKPILCRECHILACQPGQPLCARCLSLPPPHASSLPPDSLAVAEGAMDPFGSFPIEVDSRVSELLNHFLSVMSPGTIAVDIRHKSNLIRTDWFGTALNSRAFMHSLLCAAALHLYIVGKGSYFSIVYHKAQAVTAINAALSDPELGISDANIGAVFNLLCVEESLLLPIFQEQLGEDGEEEPNQRMIHLNGLKRMVELRGGLGAIKSNRCLQAFILWHSTAHAIASFDPPYLSPLGLSTKERKSICPPGYRPVVSENFVDLCRSVSISESLIEIIQDLLTYAFDLNSWFSTEGSPLDPLDIQNHASILECLFLQWLRGDDDPQTIHTAVEESLCIALLIFVFRAAESIGRREEHSHLHYTATKRLQEALSATSQWDWVSCPDLLLWILAAGAVSAEGSTECAWLEFQLSTACAEFRIESLDSLIEHLHQCVWVNYKLDMAAERLWDQISHLRLEPSIAPYASGPLQFQVSEHDYQNWQTKRWFNTEEGFVVPKSPYLSNGAPIWVDDGLYDAGLFYVICHDKPTYTLNMASKQEVALVYYDISSTQPKQFRPVLGPVNACG